MFEHELKNAYIGKKPYYDYTPTSSTIAYYPFKEDINDHSWNGNNLSIASGTVSYSDNKITISNGLQKTTGILNGVSWAFTISFWTVWNGNAIYDADSWWPQWYNAPRWGDYWWNAIINNSWRRAGNTTSAGTASDFVLMTIVYNWSQFLAYLNGTQTGTVTSCTGNIKWTATKFVIEWWTRWQVIIERWAWSASEVLDYYNNSKWNYWL